MARRQSRTEAVISDEVMAFQRKIFGRGPDRIHTYIIDALAVVRCCGVLTVFERRLVDTVQGRSMVRDLREQVFRSGAEELSGRLEGCTGRRILYIHSSLSPERDEWVYVIEFEDEAGERCS